MGTYIDKVLPGVLVITLVWLPEKILKGPKFSVQVVVDGDTTAIVNYHVVALSLTVQYTILYTIYIF